MAEFKVNCDNELYQNIISGIQTYLLFQAGDCNYQVGDTVILSECRKGVYTGRRIVCVITCVYRFVHFNEPSVLISFQILFPEAESRIPVKVFTELFHLYNQRCKECEALKEVIEK